MWKGLNVAVKTITFQDRVAGGEKAQHRAILEAAISSSLAYVGIHVSGVCVLTIHSVRWVSLSVLKGTIYVVRIHMWRMHTSTASDIEPMKMYSLSSTAV